LAEIFYRIVFATGNRIGDEFPAIFAINMRSQPNHFYYPVGYSGYAGIEKSFFVRSVGQNLLKYKSFYKTESLELKNLMI